MVFLAIGIGLFWLAIRGEDINKILNEFRHANYGWVLFSVVFMIASHILRALRWNQLIKTLRYKTKAHTTFYAVMIGYFVNLAVPRLGEITRCGVLARHNKIPVHSVIGTVIAERAFDIISLAIILLVTFFSQIYFLRDFFTIHIVDPIVSKFPSGLSASIAIFGGGILFILVIALLYKALLSQIKKFPFFYKIKRLIIGFLDGIKTIKRIKQKKIFLLYSFLMWLMYLMTIYFCFFSIKATSGLSIIDGLTVLAIGSIGVLAPTPGGVGAYQYVVGITLVGLFQIDRVSASTFANIVFFSQWLLIIIFGGLSWVILFLSQKKINKNEHN